MVRTVRKVAGMARMRGAMTQGVVVASLWALLFGLAMADEHSSASVRVTPLPASSTVWENAKFQSDESPTGRWWVTLEAAPTLAFEGGTLRPPAEATRAQGQRRQSDGPRFAATSPEITRQRFDVNAPAVRAYARALDSERARVIDEASALIGRPLAPHWVTQHTTNGFSAAMTSAEAAQLAQLDGVVSVAPVAVFAPQMDQSPTLVRADTLWNGSWNPWAPLNNLPRVRGEGMVIGIIDSGINASHRVFSASREDGFATHDFTNPYGRFLGECNQSAVTCNDKLVGIYDFTTEGSLGLNTANDGHGTHVAAIAGGNPWTGITLSNTDGNFSMTGIAPHAHIISYKVCYEEHPTNPDLNNRCVGDAILKAFERAILNEVDVVNYSIGGGASDPWRQPSIARTVLNFWSANIPFVTSAGNDGPASSSVGSPANAPWALAVGNSTHSRRVSGTVDVGTRTNLAAQAGTGPDLTDDLTAPARRVDEVSPGNLLACDPLPSDSLQGEIAVIRRGDCFFSDKVEHAEAAGAVGVIMVNQEPGQPIIMGNLEQSNIPSVMISRDSGNAVLSDLQSGPLTATMKAEQTVIVSPDLRDALSNSSSRGPNPEPRDILKPNLVAPGDAIFSADIPDERSLAFRTGTSMSSPQVTGAIALLRQIHPSWSVAALKSAVMTTAEPVIRVQGVPATPDEQGSGRLRIDHAARVGLYLPVTRQQFLDADPSRGGVPRALNLPGMVNSNCGEQCDFTRRVRAHRSGTWQVTTEGDLNVSVSPTEFSLQAGEEQVLQIQARPSGGEADVAQHAQVVLTPVLPSSPIPTQIPMVAQRLTVNVISGITDLPGGLLFETRESRGGGTVEVESVQPVDELRFVSSSLILPERETIELVQHANVDDPFDGAAGTETFFFDVPTGAMALYAATLSSTAEDIDLFVGFSPSGDDVVDPDSLACAGVTPDEKETCVISKPSPGRWWMVVQNWQASSDEADVEDEVVVARAIAMPGDDTTLTVEGPGRHSGGPMDLRVTFDQPLITPNQTWFGALAVREEGGADLGTVPLLLERIRWMPPRTTVLFPDEPYTLTLEAGSVHDRLFIDVPPSTEALRVHVQGDAGVSASLRRMDFDDLLATQPVTPSAPGADLVSDDRSGAGFELVWPSSSGTALEAGRYYVVLENQPVRDRTVTVTAELTEVGAQAPRRGLWDPEGEVINQGVEYQTLDGVPFATWYSYDEGGLPMFYLGANASRADSAIWVAPLDRYSSGGNTNINALVGRVSMTAIDEDRAVFSWRLKGAHGSWLMQPSVPEACVKEGDELRSYTGHWHSPDLAQGGATTIMMPQAQFHVRYYYDGAGVGRWVVLAGDDAGPQDEILDVLEFRGFCPNCSPVVPDSEVVGEYFREFSSEATGEERLEFVSRPPLNQDFVTQVPIERLSDRLACP